MRRRTVAAQLAAILLLLASTAAVATDGVIEINQAKALAGGVTGADGPGFPVTLSGGGSYRLTSDLDVSAVGPPDDVNTDAIEVQGGDSTTIDLNGFTIRGPANCDSFPCLNGGAGAGIRSSANSNRLLTVRNGSVVRMGGTGLNVTGGSVRITDVSVFQNGAGGIALNTGVVSRVVVEGNGGIGVDAYDAVVESSFFYGNAGTELQMTFGTIDSCTVNANGGLSIQLAQGLLRGTHVKTSSNFAVSCTTACALSENRFSECNGANCLTGGGNITQIPPASNMCGGLVCP